MLSYERLASDHLLVRFLAVYEVLVRDHLVRACSNQEVGLKEREFCYSLSKHSKAHSIFFFSFVLLIILMFFKLKIYK